MWKAKNNKWLRELEDNLLLIINNIKIFPDLSCNSLTDYLHTICKTIGSLPKTHSLPILCLLSLCVCVSLGFSVSLPFWLSVYISLLYFFFPVSTIEMLSLLKKICILSVLYISMCLQV